MGEFIKVVDGPGFKWIKKLDFLSKHDTAPYGIKTIVHYPTGSYIKDISYNCFSWEEAIANCRSMTRKEETYLNPSVYETYTPIVRDEVFTE